MVERHNPCDSRCLKQENSKGRKAFFFLVSFSQVIAMSASNT